MLMSFPLFKYKIYFSFKRTKLCEIELYVYKFVAKVEIMRFSFSTTLKYFRSLCSYTTCQLCWGSLNFLSTWFFLHFAQNFLTFYLILLKYYFSTTHIELLPLHFGLQVWILASFFPFLPRFLSIIEVAIEV